MQAPHTVLDALPLAVSPVIMISACGLLLLSMTNRLGRAIDRTRITARESHEQKKVQLEILLRRARLLRSSILFASISIIVTTLLVLTLFLAVFAPFDVGFFVALFFTVALLSLIASLVYFTIDIFSSLHAMEIEVARLQNP